MDGQRRRRRSGVVGVGVAALTFASLTGCSSTADHAEICVDRNTQQRLNDDDCDGNNGSRGFYYIPRGGTVPSVGSKVSGGSFTKPSTGTISRGGFKSSGFGIGG